MLQQPVSASDRPINAHPTKQFFIDMLTRDVDLMSCITDLIDNSIDGARRLRNESAYSGLTVRLTYDAKEFLIEDNCGGIAPDLARDYAFRLGRDPDYSATPNSIGQFGVGMKRALFKLGRHFEIESTALIGRFRLEVDVDEWSKDRDNWTLTFQECNEEVRNPPEITGTRIRVTSLDPEVAAKLTSATFESQLAQRVRMAHVRSVDAGLAITMNGTELEKPSFSLIQTDDIRPAKVDRTYSNNGAGRITVQLLAGLAKSEPDEAGWYVFCNDRLVVAADKSPLSGWGTRIDAKLPRYHNQYARFRGYAFMQSEQPASLPWNTTKDGLDTTSRSYRALAVDLVKLMRPVVTFLAELDAENDFGIGEPKPLTDALAGTDAHLVPLGALADCSAFLAPQRRGGRRPKTANVQYKVAVEELAEAKRRLSVDSNREVGEATFRYYMAQEVL